MISLKCLFSIWPVLLCTTIKRASSLFLDGYWAIRFRGRSKRNCDNFMNLMLYTDCHHETNRLGNRSQISLVKPDLTAPGSYHEATNACKGKEFLKATKNPAWNSIQQLPGIFPGGVPENIICLSYFFDLTLVHDHDPVTEIVHHAQVM